MTKYSFLDDYSEGCHPAILKALTSTNLVQQTAYGNDEYCELAKNRIQSHLSDKQTPVFFVAGGTLANIIITSSVLRSHEAVISAHSGHMVVRETGAIEAVGHKIITVPSDDGKLTSDDISNALENNAHYPHMAKPRLVYISNATELGTVYTKAELIALSEVCRANGLLLMMDGARLGTALTSDISTLTLQYIAELTDIFWIGGTKAGALIGEAIVIPNISLANDFSFHIKQRGALLAKGRLLGIQFAQLFKDDLFFRSSQFANRMARKLSKGIVENGHDLASITESNQIFPILPNPLIEKLQENFAFYQWQKLKDNHSVIRLVTSWATDEQRVDEFVEKIS
ncbi:MAG: threonine aldolase [Parasphingorhabdus sp.]|jgi:threonine aldolase